MANLSGSARAFSTFVLQIGVIVKALSFPILEVHYQ